MIDDAGHAQGAVAIGATETGFENRHIVDVGVDALGLLDGQHIAHGKFGQCAQRGGDAGKVGVQLDIGGAHFLAQALAPATVTLGAGFLQRAREQLAVRLDHRVGQADLEVAAVIADLQMEAGAHHDLVGRAGDIGELDLHFAAQIVGFHGVDRRPGVAVGIQGQLHQALDDALFGTREFATL